MEKILKPLSGYLALAMAIICLFASFFALLLGAGSESKGISFVTAITLFIVSIFLFKGLMVINPNYSRICVFFGKYVGTVKANGLQFVNPLYTTTKMSLRLQNLETAKLKVNDKLGNPIEIAAVMVWGIEDTYKAGFEVADYAAYIELQSEAALRHLATTCPYDQMDDSKAILTLRDGGENVNEILEKELNERLFPAGIFIKEARISHLAYAPEIAGAMLQRQQAAAIVAARGKIVEGAVGIVEMALEQLNKKGIVQLNDDKKAILATNLMVVLCSEKAAAPVISTNAPA
ncbi:MAG: SPFH domain-containing protein [Chitinophagaceae bacterium]